MSHSSAVLQITVTIFVSAMPDMKSVNCSLMVSKAYWYTLHYLGYLRQALREFADKGFVVSPSRND